MGAAVSEWLVVLSEKSPKPKMRDALHAATALNRGIEQGLTADRAFDDVPGLDRVDHREAIGRLIPG